MKNFSFSFFLMLLLVGTGGGMNVTFSQQVDEVKLSETRITFLEKSSITNRLISDIELKWNWIVVTPVEDSIAKAQGWYIYMGKRKEELKAELITLEFDQLINYYQDILDLNSVTEDERKNLISQMQTKRSSLAHNYPQHTGYFPETENEIDKVRNWISVFHDEYSVFTAFLENLVTSLS